MSDWKEQLKTKLPRYFKMDSRCMHFNFYDLEKIRKNIDEDLKPFYSRKEKNCLFATSAKIYPYHNSIVSLRVIIAVFFKIPEYEVSTEDLEDYRLSMKEADEPIKEEEDSDDEEEAKGGEGSPGENKNEEKKEENKDIEKDGKSPK